MTRYFLDTEFIEDGRTVDLLSIGVVCEDGRQLYAESADADLSRANPWVQENVLPHLGTFHDSFGDLVPTLTRAEIRDELRAFTLLGESRPQFWGYFADYDWVVVCQLFGTMMDLPYGWPMLCMDLKQLAIQLGDPTLPEQTGTEHHALADAQWNQEVFDFLKDSVDPYEHPGLF